MFLTSCVDSPSYLFVSEKLPPVRKFALRSKRDWIRDDWSFLEHKIPTNLLTSLRK